MPARLQTPLSVQKLRQDSCATTVVGGGAAGGRGGSVSSSVGGGGGGNGLRRPSSLLSMVPSPRSPLPLRAGEDGGGEGNWELVLVRSGSCGEEILVGMAGDGGGSV